MNPLISLSPLAAVNAVQSASRPLGAAASHFAEILSDHFSGSETPSTASDIAASQSTGGDDAESLPTLVEKIASRLRELLGIPENVPANELEIELSPLGHVYLNSDDWRARTQEGLLNSDGPLRDLLAQWSSRSGQSQLKVDLDLPSKMPQST